jgi:MHS family proline/betaine transporter-like MFS transporter
MTGEERAVLIGNSLTKYNQMLFSLLAPYWAPVLFTQRDPVVALMLTYSLFFIDWIVRPLGAYYWGWLADRKGRAYALRFSLMGVGVSMFLLTGLPHISQPNTLSPQIIALVRFIQSFFSAGESTNGVVWLLEQTAYKRRHWMSSVYDFSSTVGGLIAVLLAAMIGRWSDLNQQWPWLFRLSSVLVCYSLIARAYLIDVSYSSASVNTYKLSFTNLLRSYGKPLCAIIIASGFYHSTYHFAFTLLQGYLPLISPVSAQSVIEMNIILIILDSVLLLVAGRLADFWGYRTQMLGAATAMLLSTIPLFYLLQKATNCTVLIVRIWVVVLGVLFSAPYHAWVQALLPYKVRSRIAGLGYTLGSRLLGMPISVISLWLFQKTGLVGAPFLYLGCMACSACMVVYYSSTIKNTEL